MNNPLIFPIGYGYTATEKTTKKTSSDGSMVCGPYVDKNGRDGLYLMYTTSGMVLHDRDLSLDTSDDEQDLNDDKDATSSESDLQQEQRKEKRDISKNQPLEHATDGTIRNSAD